MPIPSPSPAERSRTLTWLRRSARDLLPVGATAGDLLAARLSGRRRALRLIWVPAVAAVLAWVQAIRTSGPVGATDRSTRWTILLLVIIAGIGPVREVLIRRADRAVAADLPVRVGPSARLRLPDVLGRWRGAVFAAAVATDVAIGVWLPSSTPGHRIVVPYTLCLAVVFAFAIIGLRQLLTRPGLAVDATSLALDQRLRWDDSSAIVALLALPPMALSALARDFADIDPSWFPLAVPVPMILILLGSAARPPRPRPPAPRVAVG